MERLKFSLPFTPLMIIEFQIKPERGEPAHPTPTYRFTLEDIPSLLAALTSYNLTCNVSLPSRGEAWRNVNDQLAIHLNRYNIDFLSASACHENPAIPGDPYFQSPMILIAPRSLRQSDSRRFVQTDLVGGDFKVPSLVLLANKVTNPCDGDQRPILFFCKYTAAYTTRN
jgi:hypothetical protein